MPDDLPVPRGTTWRVWKRLLARPSVVLMGGFGAWGLSVATLTGNPGGFFGVMGLTGLFIAGVSAVTGYLRRGDRIRAQIAGELRQRRQAAIDHRLRDLELALGNLGDHDAADDVRTLRNLRARLDRGVAGDGFSVPPEIAGMAGRLYDHCVDTLTRAVQLGRTMNELTTAEVRAEAGQHRRRLLQDVDAAVKQLGLTLDRLQTMPLTRDFGEADFEELRGELDQSLQVARRVEQRMGELERSMSGPRVRA